MITYILIGIIFMFLLEYVTSTNIFKKYKNISPKAFEAFGFWERFMGVLLWPILLIIFLYSFLIEFFR
tara:strand:- start:45 stop:248 length:204 start_codon:yes stop_codon:yes gene_type:complete